MKKILIVNPFGIGDVLFTTPMIAVLKTQPAGFSVPRPVRLERTGGIPPAPQRCELRETVSANAQVSISYLANARTAPVLRNDHRIDKVLVYERDEFVALYQRSPWNFLLKWKALIDEIRGGHYDAALDLSMGSPLSLALALAGIPKRIGFDYKGRGRWLTDKVPFKGYEGRPVAEYYLDLLGLLITEPRAESLEHRAKSREYGTADSMASGAKPIGTTASTALSSRLYAPSSYRMSLFTSPADEAWAEKFLHDHQIKGDFICLYPGGGASWGKAAYQKRWSPENYAKLADKLLENSSFVIILLGDQNDSGLCEAVVQAANSGFLGRITNAAGRTTVLQAAALMHRARFVVTNDGGPLHIGVAVSGRTVSIFGPVDPTVYGPFPADTHKVILKGLPCQPCYRNFRMSDCQHLSCLRSLTVDDVWQGLVATGVLTAGEK